MDATTALTGALPIIILVSAVLTVVFSFILLKLYRRAVIRSMGVSGGDGASSVGADAIQQGSTTTELVFSTLGQEDGHPGSISPDFKKTSDSLRQLGYAYALAGAAYATVLSLPWMLTAGGGFPLMRFVWLFVCYFWPAIVVITFVAAVDRKEKRVLIGGYFAVVTVIGLITLVRNVDLTLGQLLFFWGYVNGAPTLLLSLLLLRKIRAVTPLVLAFMVAGITGAVFFVTIVDADESLLSLFVEFGQLFGMGASSVFILIHLVGFVLLGVVGWKLLGRLGNIYRDKGVSDESIKVDAILLMFAVLQSMTLVFEGWLWIFTGLVAFVAFKYVAKRRFSNFSLRSMTEEVPSLLLLRVFSLGDRSERLFESLSKRWLRLGSIDMIAGPDLVSSTVEPHEFLSFVGGKLSRSFINSATEFEERLKQRDQRPDPDGRFRVNEFFCRDDTWQMCVQELSAKNSVVLMDLRSFSKQNQGCLWEVKQLLTDIPLRHVIFAVNETTDHEYLKQTMQSIWNNLSKDSPNLEASKPMINLISISSSSSSSVDYLINRLLEAARQ
jgi:hypothetical protein